MKKIVSYVAMGLAFGCAVDLGGCSDDGAQKAPAAVAQTGTLKMNLETVSASGKVYRLRNAFFEVNPSFFFEAKGEVGATGSASASPDGGPISAGGSPGFPFTDSGVAGSTGTGGFGGFPIEDGGIIFGGSPGFGGAFPAGGTPSDTGGFAGAGAFGGGTGSGTIELSSENNPDDPVIETFLSPSSYTIQLFDGWFMEQVDNLLGTATPVQASLLSDTFQFFDIQSNQETFVQYQFLVNGERVGFGPPGRLIVGIGVTETNGTCGNGVLDPGEVCDGANFGGETCASATLGSAPFGTLFCSSDCLSFDTTFCFGQGTVDGGGGTFGGGGFGGGFPVTDGGFGGAGGAAGAPTTGGSTSTGGAEGSAAPDAGLTFNAAKSPRR